MTRPKKLKLKLKPLIPPLEKIPSKPKKPLFYSGYALTDNLSFVLFGIEKQFLLDNFIQDDILGFNFGEDSVDMRIDRNVSITPTLTDQSVIFGNIGVIEAPIFDLIKKVAANIWFVPVVEWFGQEVNSLICCLSSDSGKPVAVVKTI